MKQNEKVWLSDYKSRKLHEKEKVVTTREILKMTQAQTEELRLFLKSVSKIRPTEREPYSELPRVEH